MSSRRRRYEQTAEEALLLLRQNNSIPIEAFEGQAEVLNWLAGKESGAWGENVEGTEGLLKPISDARATTYGPVPSSEQVLPNLSAWQGLISFRPPVSIQRSLQNKTAHLKDWPVHRIENAYGPINLDYYPVTVTRLPVLCRSRFCQTPAYLL